MQPFFYKTYWDTAAYDVWDIVRTAFDFDTFPPTLAETLIIPIPKVDNPTTLKEFLPISLCNVFFKIIPKVLVHKIRPHMDSIIGPLQSSFIPNRGTTNNAILS